MHQATIITKMFGRNSKRREGVSGMSGWGKMFALCVFIWNCYLAQSQTMLSDCSGAIEVCGNGAISSNATGFGVQEITSNACSSFEHHSLWIKIEITRPGTLGFTLKPTSSSIEVDYDFFVFGPNVSCGNLGNSIRCSTTNPLAASQGNNLTGMNDQETDVSEGPGALGNSFIKSLDVLPGETYFIVIDRPIGTSPFDLEWTGTATIDGSPFPEGVEANEPEDLFACASELPVKFDVASTRSEINNQPQTSIRYFPTLEDAVDKTNEISTTYSSSLPRKTIYARVENNLTGCYDIVDFDLVLEEGPPVFSQLDYEICDLDKNGTEIFDLNSQNSLVLSEEIDAEVEINYFRTRSDAENFRNEVIPMYSSTGESLYVRVQEKEGSSCYSISQIELKVIIPDELNEINPELVRFKISSETIKFDVANSENYLFALNNPLGPYQQEQIFTDVPPGLNMVFVQSRDRCAISSVEILVPKYSAFFSPNNDGFNDQWWVSTGSYPVPNEPVRIFDRYGKLLGKFFVNAGSWDGTLNGSVLPADDYWFEFSLPENYIIKGHFSLLR